MCSRTLLCVLWYSQHTKLNCVVSGTGSVCVCVCQSDTNTPFVVRCSFVRCSFVWQSHCQVCVIHTYTNYEHCVNRDSASDVCSWQQTTTMQTNQRRLSINDKELCAHTNRTSICGRRRRRRPNEFKLNNDANIHSTRMRKSTISQLQICAANSIAMILMDALQPFGHFSAPQTIHTVSLFRQLENSIRKWRLKTAQLIETFETKCLPVTRSQQKKT